MNELLMIAEIIVVFGIVLLFQRFFGESGLYICMALASCIAQIGAAKLIMDDHSSQLEKVAYFNGIGMKYNKLLFWEKGDEINALKA